MTIPTLIKNYQDKVTVTKLRKTKAVTEQMFKMMMVTDGVEQLSKTSVWALLHGERCYFDDITSSSWCEDFYNAFKNYAKFEIDITRTKYSYLYQPDSISLPGSLILPDGAALLNWTIYAISTPATTAQCDERKKLGGSMCSYVGDGAIDVNGASGPNVYGRDIFLYYISDEGRLYAHYGKDHALYYSQTPLATNTSYWRNAPSGCGTPGKKDIAEQRAYGFGCAARIEENDWKIDY